MLVEAKATRLTQLSRMGGDSLEKDLQRTLPHALHQLENTANLIVNRAPVVSHIPHDRPIFGLVATMEPYHVIGKALHLLGISPPSIPITLASISDFERLVADFLAIPLTLRDMEAHTETTRVSWNVDELVARSGTARHANPMLDDEQGSLIQPLFELRG